MRGGPIGWGKSCRLCCWLDCLLVEVRNFFWLAVEHASLQYSMPLGSLLLSSSGCFMPHPACRRRVVLVRHGQSTWNARNRIQVGVTIELY